MTGSTRCAVLAGGVGGSKLVTGLANVLDPAGLTVIGNIGDDVELHGLAISPDLDIVMYALAGLVNPATGWGLAGDTFHLLDALKRLGAETWFRLGDQDLATHILRTQWLREGVRPTEIALRLGRALGIASRVIPPSDDPVRTRVRTPHGWMGFQEFFVREQCRPEILEVDYRGATESVPSGDALDAIVRAGLVVIAPSNPIASIGPILAVPGIREALLAATSPRVAVSPLVAGASLKGPSDRMMRAAELPADAFGIARHYKGLIDGLVIDTLDAALAGSIEAMGVRVRVADTVMKSDGDRLRLAEVVVAFGGESGLGRS
jgi:LPPG:FO 2-phospho-L-lactate transferase